MSYISWHRIEDRARAIAGLQGHAGIWQKMTPRTREAYRRIARARLEEEARDREATAKAKALREPWPAPPTDREQLQQAEREIANLKTIQKLDQIVEAKLRVELRGVEAEREEARAAATRAWTERDAFQRERNEARTELEQVRSLRDTYRRERDEARARIYTLEALRQKDKSADIALQDQLRRVVAERDEARAKVRELEAAAKVPQPVHVTPTSPGWIMDLHERNLKLTASLLAMRAKADAADAKAMAAEARVVELADQLNHKTEECNKAQAQWQEEFLRGWRLGKAKVRQVLEDQRPSNGEYSYKLGYARAVAIAQNQAGQ